MDADTEYTVYFAGITEDVAAESTMKDSEIVGLMAMEAYLDRVDISKPADIIWKK